MPKAAWKLYAPFGPEEFTTEKANHLLNALRLGITRCHGRYGSSQSSG